MTNTFFRVILGNFFKASTPTSFSERYTLLRGLLSRQHLFQFLIRDTRRVRSVSTLRLLGLHVGDGNFLEHTLRFFFHTMISFNRASALIISRISHQPGLCRLFPSPLRDLIRGFRAMVPTFFQIRLSTSSIVLLSSHRSFLTVIHHYRGVFINRCLMKVSRVSVLVRA